MKEPKNHFGIGGLDRRTLFLGAGLAALGIGYQMRTPTFAAEPIDDETFSDAIPDQIGGWKSRESVDLVLPAEDEAQDALYQNLETRIYEGAGLPAVMFLLGFSSIQQNNIQIHRPEVCYPANGFPILSAKSITIDHGQTRIGARELVAKRGELNERIIYWVRVGDDFPTGWLEQRLSMARSNLLGQIPDGLLLRVSMIEAPGLESSSVLRDFISTLLEETSESFREEVFL
ncbi:MAG: exosortase C-terminal domain/associated protein EpsI [Pseudomonadota bacterium]